MMPSEMSQPPEDQKPKERVPEPEETPEAPDTPAEESPAEASPIQADDEITIEELPQEAGQEEEPSPEDAVESLDEPAEFQETMLSEEAEVLPEAGEPSTDEVPEDASATSPAGEEQEIPPSSEEAEEAPSPDQAEEGSAPDEAKAAPPDTHEILEAEESVEVEEPSEPFIITGIVREVFDFVQAFDTASYEQSLAVSASLSEVSGGVRRPAIFQHPLGEGVSRLRYRFSLPDLAEGERLVLSFSIGLRDGIPEEDPSWDGVRFGLEINGERVFSGFSGRCAWEDHLLDLTPFAGQEVEFVWLTDAGEAGNSSYDWALWGAPRVLQLCHVEAGLEGPLTRGWILGQPDDDESVLGGYEFDEPEGKSVPQLAEEGRRWLEERWQSSVSAVAVFTYEPQLEIADFGPMAAVVPAGEDFFVQCTVRNVGKVAIRPPQKVTVALEGVRLNRDRVEKSLRPLAPDEEAQVQWRVRSFSRERTAQMSVTLKHTGDLVQQTLTQPLEFPIERPMPRVSEKASKELAAALEPDHLRLENESLRATFVLGQSGIGYARFFVARGGQYHLLATSAPLAAFGYLDDQGQPVHVSVRPTEYALSGSHASETSLQLKAIHEDAEGGRWSVTIAFELKPGQKTLRTSYQLSVDAPRQLLYFYGPTLYAGDGAFGVKKDFALFPGLEFLEGTEVSSSARDADPPLHLRLVPHPAKITVPLMAVEQDSMLAGLLWDPLQPWDDEHQGVAAQFASPNWYQHQENHLMRLFLPTVPEWVPENGVMAQEPYRLKPETPIRLEARILLDGSGHILDAVRHWTDLYGLPQPAPPPRDDVEEIKLSRHAFLESVWDAEHQASRHCVGWKSANTPGFATLLWYDYLATRDEEVLQRVHLIAERTLERAGGAGLASPVNCHILRWEFPFYYGHLEGALEGMRQQIQSVLSQQQEDGSWRFRPRDERTQTLGREGDAVLGTCAYNAWLLLKYARVSGEEEALQAGLKALRFMRQFKVPRGAQAWECPLYEPDILAAGHAVGAYVEAYRITGDRRYLHQAEYWARTGLPFLYHWNYPDRPGMRYASIPVFGTTFYTHSWFGVPVQWNGLVYAYHVLHLSEFSDRDFWRTIVEGILNSAMHQQWTEGPLKGTYPDGFYGYCTEGRGPHINPEDIMVNLFALRGADPDIKTQVLSTDRGRVHISSGAEVIEAQIDADQRLRFDLRYVAGYQSYTLITGLESPGNVLVDGEILELKLGEDPGWYYVPERRHIFLRVHHEHEQVRIEICPPVPMPIEEEGERPRRRSLEEE